MQPSDTPTPTPEKPLPPQEPLKGSKKYAPYLFPAALILVHIILLSLPIIWCWISFNTPGPLTENKTVVISKGTKIYEIGDLLQKNEVIWNPLIFRLAVNILGDDRLMAGEYLFTPDQSLSDVVKAMHEGKTVIRRFTLVEGATSYDAVDLLNNDPVLIGSIEETPPEGSLFPATYRYVYHDDRAEIVQQMKKKQREFLQAVWEKRDTDLPLKTPEEAVIMASVIEKETGKGEERPRIAGVFYNRLKRGMRLQSDPTVIYALTHGEIPLARSLTRADLGTLSPYNTYVNAGLPPQPICNPGKAALEAALHPEKHDFLYFVADGTGGHVFAKDLAEHNRNVANWNKINKD